MAPFCAASASVVVVYDLLCSFVFLEQRLPHLFYVPLAPLSQRRPLARLAGGAKTPLLSARGGCESRQTEEESEYEVLRLSVRLQEQ